MFIILLSMNLYRCGSRDVTVLLLHLQLLKNEAVLLFEDCNHIRHASTK